LPPHLLIMQSNILGSTLPKVQCNYHLAVRSLTHSSLFALSLIEGLSTISVIILTSS
jgi:hypothetical protein